MFERQCVSGDMFRMQIKDSFDGSLPRVHGLFGQAVDQAVEDHRRGQDDAGLEAAAGAEVAVELHIQHEQQD